MRPLVGVLAAAVALVAPAAAAAQVVSERADSVQVTIYRSGPADGLAFVTETRTVELPAGVSRVEFRGVADRIIMPTAAVDGLEGRVLERNEDFDILSPGSLVQRAVGRPARLVRTNPVTGEETSEAVTLLTGPSGVVVRRGDRIEALGCSGGPERLVFDGVPPSLRDRPTLSAVVRSPTAGRRRVTLSYLAGGLAWEADYVARLNADGRTLDLLGWLTIRNDGRTTFADVPAQVVAGDLSRDWSTRPRNVAVTSLSSSCWPVNAGFEGVQPERTLDYEYDDAMDYAGRGRGAPAMAVPPPPPPSPPPPPAPVVASASQLGDYQLYSLPGPTTLAAAQSKQVRFLIANGVPYEAVYVHEGGTGAQVTPVLRLQNTAEGGLNMALPRGDLVLTDARRGSPGLIATTAVPFDVAAGLPFELRVGAPSPLAVEERSERRILSDKRTVVDRTVVFRSRRSSPLTVEVREPATGVTVSAESAPHQVRDARRVWRLVVPPNGEARLTYTVDPSA